MGSVTGCAISLEHNPVSAPCILWQYLHVAILAELGAACGQQILVGGGMGIMTSSAIPLLYQRMDKGAFNRFLKRFMTLQAYFTLSTGL